MIHLWVLLQSSGQRSQSLGQQIPSQLGFSDDDGRVRHLPVWSQSAGQRSQSLDQQTPSQLGFFGRIGTHNGEHPPSPRHSFLTISRGSHCSRGSFVPLGTQYFVSGIGQS